MSQSLWLLVLYQASWALTHELRHAGEGRHPRLDDQPALCCRKVVDTGLRRYDGGAAESQTPSQLVLDRILRSDLNQY